MKLYRLRFTQKLPIHLSQAWDFFSNPANLSRITPAWLNFEVTSDLPERMYAGMLITYRIRPIAGLPLSWVTEITHVDEPYSFIDEQRFGPYRFWHHRHLFREKSDGIEVEDVVHYALPLGVIGRLINRLIIRRRLEEIFEFRRRALEEIFATERTHIA
jgi:ligand-binding SRPBCC domain-containing protein